MNLFICSGYIAKDCEVRVTPNGKSIANFSLPVRSGYGDHEKTTWVDCKLFGKRAEGKLPGMLTKGTKVTVSGELTNRQYDKQDGSKGYSLELAINDLELMSKGSSNEPQQQNATPDHQGGDFDDDIPFANPYKRSEYIV